MYIQALFVALVALAALGSTKEVRIAAANDLINFANAVNSGTDYSGTTVLLDSDIVFSDELSKKFNPIGKSSDNYFRGISDGQGYAIKNLTVSSSSRYVGLFGFSYGLTIKNVVIDDSCIIENSHKGDDYAFIGGIIGRCDPNNNLCNIENSVNMAYVTFNGNVGDNLYIGGIIGLVSPVNQGTTIKNCINYGTITNTGTTTNTYIGGITGEIYTATTNLGIFIQNCANYGAINNNGGSSGLYMGGIIGTSWNTTIENCLSVGKIVSSQTSDRIGNVAGSIGRDLTSTISHCYWTSNTGVNASHEQNEEIHMTELNEASMNELNRYAEMKASNWSKWMTLHLNGGRIEDIAQETIVATQRAFPKPSRKGNTFVFWCNSAECTEEYDPVRDEGVEVLYAGWELNRLIFDLGNGTVISKDGIKFNTGLVYPSISEREGYTFCGWDNDGIATMPATDLTISGQWTPNNYTVTFDLGNGTSTSVTLMYGDPITYPIISEREDYTFRGWDKDGIATMPATDLTISGQWSPNNYTVTLDANGGDDLATPRKEVTFDDLYGSLPTPNRAGYSFAGWFNENNESVTSETEVTIPSNHTLHARWEVSSSYVEIVFNTKDLTEEEAKEIIRKYAGEGGFSIVEFDKDESRVIIKFNDVNTASKFINKVESSSDEGIYLVRRAGPFPYQSGSFPLILTPFIISFFLFF